MHIILCAIQCSLGFFHSTKGTDSVTFPASAQRYHPRSLFQATLPSNINATTLVLSSLGHLTHISYMWTLQATLKLTLASDSVSLVVDSMPTSLIASVTFLAITQAQLWTAHHSPSSSIASLPCLRPLLVTCPSHVGSSSLDISSDCNL